MVGHSAPALEDTRIHHGIASLGRTLGNRNDNAGEWFGPAGQEVSLGRRTGNGIEQPDILVCHRTHGLPAFGRHWEWHVGAC